MRLHVFMQTFLIACCTRDSLQNSNPSAPAFCVESRTQLASAVAMVASLEAQLEDARRWLIAKELQVRACESNAEETSRAPPPGPAAGCNYCLAFQRVSDYALPRFGTHADP